MEIRGKKAIIVSSPFNLSEERFKKYHSIDNLDEVSEDRLTNVVLAVI